jgi:outer membrane lipoprotein-sorting protein
MSGYRDRSLKLRSVFHSSDHRACLPKGEIRVVSTPVCKGEFGTCKLLSVAPVLLAFFCALPLFASSNASSDSKLPLHSGEQMLREASTSLSKLHSYELNVIVNQSINDGQYVRTFHTYVDTSFEQSGSRKRIRMVSRKPEDTLTIVSDGSGYWIYHESNRRYEHKSGDLPAEVYRSPTPGLSGTLSAENLPVAMKSAVLVRQETLAVGERQELCDVVLVHLRPSVAPAGYIVKNNELTLWLSHQYGVPMKVSGTFIHSNPDGKSQAMDMTVVVQKFRPNTQLPPSTWAFVPPPQSQPEPGTSSPQ